MNIINVILEPVKLNACKTKVRKRRLSLTLVEMEMASPQKHMTRYFYFLSLKE